MKRSHIVAFVLVIMSLHVSAELSPAGTAAVRAYLSSLERLERHAAGSTVAGVFQRSLALTDPLTLPPQGEASIEDLSSAEFERLRAQLRGMLVNREEIVFVKPDPAFFRALAKQHGQVGDVGFFSEYSETFPDGIWAAYIEQQTDYSGCIDFASGQLVARYRGWLSYRRKFPSSYVAQTSERLHDIEQQVTHGTCACGDRGSFLMELREFDRSFPDSPARASAHQRVLDVEQGKSTVRFKCISG